MNAFGRSGGGGHRGALRTPVPLPVLIRTITASNSAALLDISETGARLQGRNLPEEGEELDLTVENLKLFGRVVWRTDTECGIAFDAPVMSFELVGLRRRAGLPALNKLSVDERIALEQWLCGVSR